jgi:putative membrane protein
VKAELAQVLRGVGIGVAVVLPGISGGTAALILGRYQQFLKAIRPAHWRREAWLLGGGILGILAGARGVGFLLAHVPGPLNGFLFGLVAGAIPAVAGHARPIVARRLGLAVAGALVTLGLGRATGLVQVSPTLVGLFLGGAVSSGVTVLPGVSGGTILIALGQYQYVVTALNQFDWIALAAFGSGGILGLFVLSREMLRLLATRPRATMALLGGMMVGSLPVLWPGQASLTWIEGAAMLAGFVLTALARR